MSILATPLVPNGTASWVLHFRKLATMKKMVEEHIKLGDLDISGPAGSLVMSAAHLGKAHSAASLAFSLLFLSDSNKICLLQNFTRIVNTDIPNGLDNAFVALLSGGTMGVVMTMDPPSCGDSTMLTWVKGGCHSG